MNAPVEALMQRVHELVDKEVRTYLEEKLDQQLRTLSSERNVSYEVLREDFNNISQTSQQAGCVAFTVLGKPCKYKAKKNDCLCKKHFNLIKCQNNAIEQQNRSSPFPLPPS